MKKIQLHQILLALALGAAAPVSAGTVVGWGYNSYGQAVPPDGLSGVTAIAAGGYHSLALKSDGTVVGWGYNSCGRATPPDGLSGVIAIAAGGSHSLALKNDGTVVGWGYNGNGEATPRDGLSDVTAIAAGGSHSLALKSDGTVVGWGNDVFGQATPPPGLSGVVAIAAGLDHSLALKSDGTVVAWGNNFFCTPPEGLSGVVAIAAGRRHSLALKNDGSVVGWGDNTWGQATPPSEAWSVIAIAAGNGHSLALKSDGRVIGWGYNGSGAATPPVGLYGMTAISAGLHSLALGPSPLVLDLGTLSGNGSSEAMAINKRGQVAGTSLAAGSTIPDLFLWLPCPAYGRPKGMNNLGNLGGFQIGTVALNDWGQVAGSSRSAESGWTAFLWLPSDAYGLSAGMHDLGLPTGWTWISVKAINESGQIAATGTAPDGNHHPCLWQNGEWTDLQPDLPGISSADAVGISESGQVLIRAGGLGFVWQTTAEGVRAVELPAPDWASSVSVSEINKSGQVVGTARQATSGTDLPCVWDSATGTRIDPTGDAVSALAGASGWAIGGSGQVAAVRRVGDWHHVLIWDPLAGTVADLRLPWYELRARYPWIHINARGQVAMTATSGMPDNYLYWGFIGSASTGLQNVRADYQEAFISALNDAGEACGYSWVGGAIHAILVNPDQRPPQLSGVPSGGTVEATGAAGAEVTWIAPTATDAGDGPVPVTCDPASGSTFPLGTTTVTVIAADYHCHTATASFQVTVVDTTPPSITAPPNVTAEASGPNGAPVATLGTPVVSDTVDPNPTVGNDAPAIFPLGSTTVTWTATDLSGNAATAPQTVTVRDTTPPTFSGMPAHIDAIATVVGGAYVSYTLPTASDLVDGAVAVTADRAPGSLFAPGTTTVNFRAVDARGNAATATFTVTVTFSGDFFLKPIDPPNANGVSASVFKAGSTVPVAFKLTGNSASINTLAAKVSYAKVSNGIVGTDMEAVSTAAATTGNLFRYDPTGGQYIFNWGTKGLTSGTYRLAINLGDGAPHTVELGLR